MDYGESDTFVVCVRIRPSAKELQGKVVHRIDDNTLVFDPNDSAVAAERAKSRVGSKRALHLRFGFSRVFDACHSQEYVYKNSAKLLIETLLQGLNASVLCYGATGTGKTYTMMGTADNAGVMTRTLNDVFAAKTSSVHISMSYLEIYNETVRDLLAPGSLPLQLREDAASGVTVNGLSVHQPSSAAAVFRLLSDGNALRSQSPTDKNTESSRSHAILMVTLTLHDAGGGVRRTAKLSLIDLAGSERAAVTSNKGSVLKEGCNINRSLLALGNCISALAQKDGAKFVPFRDSKLTRLLKDSLGGNSKTVMIATVSASFAAFEDTFNTLNFAKRASQIRVKPKHNCVTEDVRVQHQSVISELRAQIEMLKAQSCPKPLELEEAARDEIVYEWEEQKEVERKAQAEKAKQLLAVVLPQVQQRQGLVRKLSTYEQLELQTSLALSEREDKIATLATQKQYQSCLLTPPTMRIIKQEVDNIKRLRLRLSNKIKNVAAEVKVQEEQTNALLRHRLATEFPSADRRETVHKDVRIEELQCELNRLQQQCIQQTALLRQETARLRARQETLDIFFQLPLNRAYVSATSSYSDIELHERKEIERMCAFDATPDRSATSKSALTPVPATVVPPKPTPFQLHTPNARAQPSDVRETRRAESAWASVCSATIAGFSATAAPHPSHTKDTATAAGVAISVGSSQTSKSAAARSCVPKTDPHSSQPAQCVGAPICKLPPPIKPTAPVRKMFKQSACLQGELRTASGIRRRVDDADIENRCMRPNAPPLSRHHHSRTPLGSVIVNGAAAQA